MSIEEKKRGEVVGEVSVRSLAPVKTEGKPGEIDNPVEVGEQQNLTGKSLDLEPYHGNPMIFENEIDPRMIVNRVPGRHYRLVSRKRIERENNDRGWQFVQGKDPERFVNSSERVITRHGESVDSTHKCGDLTLAWMPEELHKKRRERNRSRANDQIRDLKDFKEKLQHDMAKAGVDPSLVRVKEGVVNMMRQRVSRGK